MEWIWPVLLVAVLLAPVILLARLRGPPAGPDGMQAGENAAKLEQLRNNNRFR
jgi:hypothetical protein